MILLRHYSACVVLHHLLATVAAQTFPQGGVGVEGGDDCALGVKSSDFTEKLHRGKSSLLDMIIPYHSQVSDEPIPRKYLVFGESS